jgi:hypothetical protein
VTKVKSIFESQMKSLMTEQMLPEVTKLSCSSKFHEIVHSAKIERAPLVSVVMITYNHEAHIAKAIEGVVQQQTEYPC